MTKEIIKIYMNIVILFELTKILLKKPYAYSSTINQNFEKFFLLE